jgi:hypothetical protein
MLELRTTSCYPSYFDVAECKDDIYFAEFDEFNELIEHEVRIISVFMNSTRKIRYN